MKSYLKSWPKWNTVGQVILRHCRRSYAPFFEKQAESSVEDNLIVVWTHRDAQFSPADDTSNTS